MTTEITIFPSVLKKETTLEQDNERVPFIIFSIWLLVKVTEIQSRKIMVLAVIAGDSILLPVKCQCGSSETRQSNLALSVSIHLVYLMHSHLFGPFLMTNIIILTFTLARNRRKTMRDYHISRPTSATSVRHSYVLPPDWKPESIMIHHFRNNTSMGAMLKSIWNFP